MRCPICKSEMYFWSNEGKSSEWANPNMKGIKFRIYKCKKCGHGTISPKVKEKQLSRYYDKEYLEEYSRDKKKVLKRHRAGELDFKMFMGISGSKKKKLKVLDYGCSDGSFLSVMPNKWKKYGYEINNEIIKKSEVRFFPHKFLEKDRFDVVFLRSTIEHIPKFDKLFRILRNSKMVYVCATPDFDSPCARIYKEKWNQMCPPLHYHYFTPASISLLFAKNGFCMNSIKHPYMETPYANFKSDSKEFIKNLKSKGDCSHPFPGNMMNILLLKVLNK